MGSGQLFEPTAEHPFWVVGRGWTPVWELTIGDSLTSMSGETVSVEGVHETDRRQTVYNLRVSDFHTYFVGCDEWGFSVWAHNAEYSVRPGKGGVFEIMNSRGQVVRSYPDEIQASVQARALNNPARPTNLPDPHNNKPSMQREIWEREELARRAAQQNAGRMTAPQAREAAAMNGWQEVANPGFNSHGQPVFTNGRSFFTPDADGHIGGVWKQFNQQGQRVGTLDANLNRLGK
ncbi:polymorphic toxin-type HINT domain-containing protein [Tuwongella immobilis]|uniref:Novel toxin 21 domain-containing protein n=1 Tax=Tuwongella immobilis TaxID=692036 RepID=A0A6C2YH32_9BACT|nr:polymorphic toxin-type HINT domain-containing protein [Tuwongella immobilis]VIP00796.1 YD repeat protein OS=Isosphaera pallida (strain ATCC 43644 / DSM 9630 / IS1B) GN=Isop_2419 PE=4 SV=1: PT-HINT: Toxin_46 [Tuwongella immobilis]VTR97010.1 YD repeat protein OS=Isosphaera pallida (strain ATCC 43644 / DSM 9630 / IS1B) GN=Isop_2419 PE=4 SV=1: PT-HINT: Toxin_46 [Tuwongella immobilis]